MSGWRGGTSASSLALIIGSAVKGKAVGQGVAFISDFKGLMTIHEHALGGDGSEAEADEQAPPVNLGDLEALQGVVKFPVRIKCATLGWNTLQQALDEAENATE